MANCQNVKLVLLGNENCGKSRFIVTISTGVFPHEYHPSAFGNFSSNIIHDKRPYAVIYWDTNGRDEYDTLRPLTYPQTDVFLLCYSIGERHSFERVKSKYYPELKQLSPHTPIILCGLKSDLRDSAETSDSVTKEEGGALAESFDVPYIENSALEYKNVKETVDLVIKAFEAHRHKTMESRPSLMQKYFRLPSRTTTTPESTLPTAREIINFRCPPLPPLLPDQKSLPKINVEPSEFANNRTTILASQKYADVKVILQGQTLNLHRAILYASSTFFMKVLSTSPADKNPFPLVVSLLEYDKSQQVTVIRLDNSIELKIFEHIVLFLYSGQVAAPMDDKTLSMLCECALKFELNSLQDACKNLSCGENDLNKNITFLKRNFLNQRLFSDIEFQIDGRMIPAHKSIVAPRCNIWSTMFDGVYQESQSKSIKIEDVHYDAFLAFLEYLYSDHVEMNRVDKKDLLELADRYNVTRLVTMCEHSLSEELKANIDKGIEAANVNLVELISYCDRHNAMQLKQFCRHILATNYLTMEKRPEFQQLEAKDREWIVENRWPPKYYFDKLKIYEEDLEIYEEYLRNKANTFSSRLRRRWSTFRGSSRT